MNWKDLYEEFSERNPHPYTREDQLADRCFETLYIVTLLERGFGFDRHEHSITFAREVLTRHDCVKSIVDMVSYISRSKEVRSNGH